MSKRLRPNKLKSRSLRPRSQKARELEVPANDESFAPENDATVEARPVDPAGDIATVAQEAATAPLVVEPVTADNAHSEEERPAAIEEQVTALDAPLSAPLESKSVAKPPAEKLEGAGSTAKADAKAKAAPVEVAVSKNDARKKSKADAAPVSSKSPPRSEGESALSKSAAAREKLAGTDSLESGVSAEFFFRSDEDSVPPFVDSPDEMDDPRLVRALSPTTIARRARLRRIVAGVVTFAAVLSIGILGKKLLSGSKASAATPPARQEMMVAAPDAKVEPAPAPEAQKAIAVEKPVAKSDPVPGDAPSAASSADPKPADTEAKTDPTKPDAKAEDKPDEAKAPDPAAAAELKKKAESLLNRGDRKGAMPVAQAAIEADPSDAYPYLLLGSALQDSGKWKEGVEQYCECVRHATRGPINECRAMGGHK